MIEVRLEVHVPTCDRLAVTEHVESAAEVPAALERARVGMLAMLSRATLLDGLEDEQQ